MKNGYIEKNIAQQVQETVKNLQQKSELPKKFVQSISSLHAKYDSMIMEHFDSHEMFTKALEIAFQSALLSKAETSACSTKLMVLYCENALKKKKPAIPESEIDDRLQQSIIVFKHLEAKDVF